MIFFRPTLSYMASWNILKNVSCSASSQISMTLVRTFWWQILQQKTRELKIVLYSTLWVWRIHRVKKKSEGKFKWKHLGRSCRNAETPKWNIGRPMLGGNFWFPRWIFFILVFWHSYMTYLNVFTWISFQTFFLPYASFKPTVE